jgi:hypothetical protein
MSRTNPTDIIEALGIEPEFVVTEADRAGFFTNESGCWLQDLNGALRVEVRLGTGIPSTAEMWEFLNEQNQLVWVGRWIFDAGVLALVCDLPLDLPMPFVIAIVGQMVDAADRAAKKTYPAGESETDQIPVRLLPLVANDLPYTLGSGWDIEHREHESWAVQPETGSTLTVQTCQHPHGGWGLMVALAGEPLRCAEADATAYTFRLNQCESFVAGPVFGVWTFWHHPDVPVGGLEHRAFLPASLLDVGDDLFQAQHFVESVITSVANHAGPVLDQLPVSASGPVLVHPHWPGDDGRL